ncbi:putative WD repeat-containing protein [Colletotrichum sp. SAR11_59]|uniref:WD domain-containing protein n=1 Tax=Colletotrichum asianum TaxID=702518 RepID=A0A8H3WIX3_9PEZI|nr:WD domain-containing protein [Colletotrichum asianum]KAI8312863.1 putative WD repeat-containing protein [Colletotrichum sp. SAR11_59]
MYNLTCVDGHHFGGEGDVYVLDLHRLNAGLAAISSDQKLTLFNPARVGQGPTRSLATSHGNLTCLKTYDALESIVCTAGENGEVSIWDLRQSSKPQVAHFAVAATQSPITSLACDSRSNTIAIGTELQNHTASVMLWDIRAGPTQRLQYDEVHSDDVTELRFHPSQPHVLLSGSTDGLVNVYDTRISDEDDVIIQALNQGSVHHASFISDTEIYVLTHDEKFAVYSVADECQTGAAVADFGDARETLGCQYIANVTTKVDGSGAIVGVGALERQVFELVHLSRTNEGSWGFDKANSVGLPGGHGDEIVRSFCFYDDEQVVFTAGEDGNIKAWRPS